jgi:predicted transposase YdaD
MGQEVLTGERTQHDYRRCRDEDCQRFACRVYREGFADGEAAGHAAGRAEGEAIGYAEGHADGYAAGAASCGDG